MFYKLYNNYYYYYLFYCLIILELISKPILLTVEERCKKILYCVERSLTSLNSKKKPDVQVVNDENAVSND